jgi:hypothetical protein
MADFYFWRLKRLTELLQNFNNSFPERNYFVIGRSIMAEARRPHEKQIQGSKFFSFCRFPSSVDLQESGTLS